MAESVPPLEVVRRIRHHLAHAIMGLVTMETEARGAMGKSFLNAASRGGVIVQALANISGAGVLSA
jgi:hypothetical protein